MPLKIGSKMNETLATPADADTETCCGNCSTVSRRTAIGVGLVAGATVLAGCSSAAETPTSSGPAPATGGAAAGLTTVDAIPDGGSLIIGADSGAIALARKGQDVVAFSAVCTHQGCAVAAAGAALNCPCHGSIFDAFTGAATRGPASVALTAIPVTVKGGSVIQG